MTYNVPVLFIIFKRKETALKSFEKIREVKPSKLYIAGDGARPGVSGEAEDVAETRKAVLAAVDWECDVKTRFLDHNMGCCMGVYTAINWLFENEEQGIIIEDDCVLRTCFFRFAEELLERYKDDARIGMIDAANYINKIKIPCSYGFSRFKSTNGWATWRRAWQLMDLDMKWRGGPFEKSIISNMGYRAKDIGYWRYRLKAVDLKDVSAWDWQWYFTLSAHNMLGIYPEYSLITNIGFGDGATHTTARKTPDEYKSNRDITFPLRHPEYVLPYEPFERHFYMSNNTLFDRIKRLFPFWFKNIVKKIVRG